MIYPFNSFLKENMTFLDKVEYFRTYNIKDYVKIYDGINYKPMFYCVEDGNYYNMVEIFNPNKTIGVYVSTENFVFSDKQKFKIYDRGMWRSSFRGDNIKLHSFFEGNDYIKITNEIKIYDVDGFCSDLNGEKGKKCLISAKTIYGYDVFLESKDFEFYVSRKKNSLILYNYDGRNREYQLNVFEDIEIYSTKTFDIENDPWGEETWD